MTYTIRQPRLQPSRRKRSWRVWLILATLFACSGLAAMGGMISYAASYIFSTEADQQMVMIHEIKSGGSNTTPSEYVTLYNGSDKEILLDGWTIEFARQTFPAGSCANSTWKSDPTVTSIGIKGTMVAHGFTQPFPMSIINDVPGSIHIVNDTGTIIDTVGWGNDTVKAPCFEGAQAPNLLSGKSLQRYVGCTSNLPIDTGNNADDFAINTAPVTGLHDGVLAPQCTLPTPIPTTPEPTPLPTPVPSPVPNPMPTPNPTPQTTTSPKITCEGVAVSEILPNPASTDTNHEFIELYNPTNDVIALDGCSLQTSASTTKSYTFTAASLQPGEYRAFYDGTTGLTLPNASGGTVWLLSPTQELQSVVYGADPDDDTSWTYAGGSWAYSYSPTPNAANIATANKPCADGQVRNTETNRCVTADTATSTADTTATATDSDSGLVPCDAGEERNPDTNRCRKIVTTATSTDCPAGQTRNPDTNRCRKDTTTAAATTVVACKEGQERNPDTNRCRNVTSATTDSKACPAGQERNQDTNRCRKIAAASTTGGGGSLAGVKDVPSSVLQHSNPYWIVAGVLLIGGIGYAVYEWRQEITLFFRNRFGRDRQLQTAGI